MNIYIYICLIIDVYVSDQTLYACIILCIKT